MRKENGLELGDVEEKVDGKVARFKFTGFAEKD